MKQLVFLLLILFSGNLMAQGTVSNSKLIKEYDRILNIQSNDMRLVTDSILAISGWDWKIFTKKEIMYIYSKGIEKASKMPNAEEQNVLISFLNLPFNSRQDVGEMVLIREKTIGFAQKLGNPHFLANAYRAIAFTFFQNSLLDDALENISKAIPIIDKVGSIEDIVEFHYSYGYMAHVYSKKYNDNRMRDTALFHLKLVYDTLFSNPTWRVPLNFEERTIVYTYALSRKKYFREAIAVALIGLDFSKQIYNLNAAGSYNYSMRFAQDLAHYYLELNNKDSTFYFLEFARRIYAKAYQYELNKEKEKLYEDSIYRPRVEGYHIKWKNELIDENHFIPWIHALDFFGDFATASQMLDYALLPENLINASTDIIYQYRNLGCKVYTHTQQYQKAADCFKFVNMYKDSISLLKDKQNYATQKIRSQVLIGIAQENHQRELEEQRLVRNGFIGGFAIMLLFAGLFLYQRNRISKEKKRSEELLLNILPEEIANELKAKGETEARQMDNVTVLFTDFKGFTALSEILSPKELVRDLHECFTGFDRIIQKHGLEKIKTIGDSYMAAGGLPSPNKSHPGDAVKAALEIRQFIEEGKARKKLRGEPYFEIRIGVHTGPVVAGIVGVKKFSYDIWGDTVNTASRMESSGVPGKVNISETTYELLKDNQEFVFENRGKIMAKGKGEMNMFFVEERYKFEIN